MKAIIIKTILFITIWLLSIAGGNAKDKIKISGGADLVSAYIWRGSYNAGASVQPSLFMSIKGLKIGAWGSTDFGGNGKKEVDLSLNYSFKGLTVGITDYWWAGEGAFKYFHYLKGSTSHLFEGNLFYELPFEKFPLSASWNTIFAGFDNDYSTYVELNYPFPIYSFDMKATVGFVPWHSPIFLATEGKGLSVCNVALMATKAINCSENFSIPLFSQLIFNPAMEDIHLVFGISLKF